MSYLYFNDVPKETKEAIFKKLKNCEIEEETAYLVGIITGMKAFNDNIAIDTFDIFEAFQAFQASQASQASQK